MAVGTRAGERRGGAEPTFVMRFLSCCILLIIQLTQLAPLWAQSVARAGAAERLTPPAALREVLPNGMRLVVAERLGSPLTAIDLRVRSGSGKETSEDNGVAHFIEHMVLKGTAARGPGEFDRAMEMLGGEITARTTRDATQFATSVPSARWKEALSLLAEMLQKPAFRPADMEQEREVIRAELAVAQSDPQRTGLNEIAAILFGPDDPYRLPIMGTKENVARFTPDDLRHFHKRWYRPADMTLVLAGDVRPDEVRDLALRLFSSSDPGVAPVPDSAPPVSVFVPLGRVVRAKPLPASEQSERDLTTFVVGFRAPGAGAEEATLPLMDALAPLLASRDQGRLVDQLVKKQKLALYVSAEYVPGRTGSLILITAITRPRDVARLEAAIADELSRLREDPPTDDEAAGARAAAQNRVRYEAETTEGLAARLARWDVADPSVTDEAYSKEVEAVTADDLKRMVQRYLTPLSYAVAVLGAAPPPSATAATASGEVR
jgi:zinc protease